MITVGDDNSDYCYPCIVEIFPHLQGSAKFTEMSSSGVLLGSSGVVLTHSSVMMQYLQNNEAVYHRLMKEHFIRGHRLTNIGVTVRLEKNQVNTAKTNKIGSSNSSRISNGMGGLRRTAHAVQMKSNDEFEKTSLEFANRACSVQERIVEKVSGGILCIWKVDSFSNALRKLVPQSDGWKFHDDPEAARSKCNSDQSRTADSSSQLDEKSKDEIDSEKLNDLLPYFVLIKLEDFSRKTGAVMNAMCSDELYRGQNVHVFSSPFGNLSPDVFMNSTSQGVVSNVAGSRNALILTDARCIPGAEGGIMCVKNQDDKFYVAGIIVAPLCWKNNEWIGLSVVCSFSEIMKSLQRTLSMSSRSLERMYHINFHNVKRGAVKSMCDRAVYVKYGTTWGTGILIDHELGIIITCSHVVQFNAKGSATIGVSGMGYMQWLVAEILYAVPKTEVLDIAILKLTTSFPYPVSDFHIAEVISEGEMVSITGHALFESDQSPSPSVTSGAISKILNVKNTPVAIQTTCAVHAGVSGGPVVDEAGAFVAMVTCNAKDSTSGAQFPHINLCIPFITVWPVLQEFLENGDSTVLRRFHIKDARLKALWLMQSHSSPGHTQSKL